MPTRDPREPFYRVSVDEAREMMDVDHVVLVDVREPFEYEKGHVPGTRLIPVGSVFNRREELPKERKILFVCAVGMRSALAAEMAAAGGFDPENLYNLEGGTDAWVKAGLPLEQ